MHFDNNVNLVYYKHGNYYTNYLLLLLYVSVLHLQLLYIFKGHALEAVGVNVARDMQQATMAKAKVMAKMG